MKSISEIFAAGDQWILPPIPLLDEKFDDEDYLVDDPEIATLMHSQHPNNTNH